MGMKLNRVLHIIGLTVAVALPVLVQLDDAIPGGTKVKVWIGVAVALLTALGKVFGGGATNTASVISVAPMETGDAPKKVLPKQGQPS